MGKSRQLKQPTQSYGTSYRGADSFSSNPVGFNADNQLFGNFSSQQGLSSAYSQPPLQDPPQPQENAQILNGLKHVLLKGQGSQNSSLHYKPWFTNIR